MLKNAIIFDILYTPYKLAKNATNEEIQKNANERAFYNMTDNTNIYKYMTTEGKIQAKKNKKITALEYLQKSTGVFNQNGMIPSEEVDAIKERAKNNKGCIWHGFISLSEEDSPNIDNPEKCIELVKNVFGKFFKDANFKEENIDLMCALHLDKPHHLHIHYMFFEKEPRFISRDGKEKEYRKKGKVDKKAIDRMLINIAEHIDGNKGNTFMRRDRAIKTLKELTKFRNINASKEDILEAILDLKKDLPKEGRLSYGAKEMEPFRDRVDNIVRMIVENNREAQDTNHKFYSEVEQRRRRIKELCNTPKKFDDGTGSFRYQINESNITIIDDIEKDYRRRQGNLIINLVKAIDAEYYERNKNRKYNTNSKYVKKRLVISTRKVKSLLGKFILTFGTECFRFERDFSNRLQEIEEEMKREQEKQSKEKKGGNYKY